MRKSTLSTITLATLLCISTNNFLLVGSAYAAAKSAVSPDVKISQPSSSQVAPAITPTPATRDIQTESNLKSSPVNHPVGSSDSSDNNYESVQPHPVQVKIETASNRSPIVESARSQSVEIVLENRSTGCKFKASSLLERDADLCNPDVAIANQNKLQNKSQSYDQSGQVLYAAASGETSVQVRRLTPEEIATMSLPSNGDKQMLFPLIMPSSISSLFGSRVHPVTGQVRFHQGTDLAAPEGTPVVAAFSGRVEIAGWLGGYGLIVVISHGDTHETRYAHLSEILVKSGQEVKQGNVIGLVGSTGMATGPHLHFEIWQKMRDGLVAIDPTPQLMLAMEQLQKYLAQSSKPANKV